MCYNDIIFWGALVSPEISKKYLRIHFCFNLFFCGVFVGIISISRCADKYYRTSPGEREPPRCQTPQKPIKYFGSTLYVYNVWRATRSCVSVLGEWSLQLKLCKHKRGYFAYKIACAIVAYHEWRARDINRRRERTHKTVSLKCIFSPKIWESSKVMKKIRRQVAAILKQGYFV